MELMVAKVFDTVMGPSSDGQTRVENAYRQKAAVASVVGQHPASSQFRSGSPSNSAASSGLAGRSTPHRSGRRSHGHGSCLGSRRGSPGRQESTRGGGGHS